MARIPHGGRITLEKVEEAEKNGRLNMLALSIPGGAGGLADFNKFGYLFPDLQANDDNLLPVGPDTVANLKRLGQTMIDTSPADESNSTVPAAYTYLGQFIDHDITFEVASGDLAKLAEPDLEPLSSADIEAKIRNTRSAKFDLDSVYEGLAERDEERMALGFVSPTSNNTVFPLKRPPGKGDLNDLPRKGRINNPAIDREALIGDPRNDENTIISQLHLAFLLSHNAIVTRGHDFEEARTLLRQHYQWMVIHDFLKKICDPATVDDTLAGNSFYDPSDYDFFMPLEFSVAGYRFGHSMIRADYDFNLNFNSSGTPGTTEASLARLFTFTAFVGQLGNFNSLPENWIIEWERFFGPAAGFNMARRFDTKLVEPLAHLTDTFGTELTD
ncbi:MAG: peroxidase family protein, partial [Pyrinomonadaceae bacterium]